MSSFNRKFKIKQKSKPFAGLAQIDFRRGPTPLTIKQIETLVEKLIADGSVKAEDKSAFSVVVMEYLVKTASARKTWPAVNLVNLFAFVDQKIIAFLEQGMTPEQKATRFNLLTEEEFMYLQKKAGDQ